MGRISNQTRKYVRGLEMNTSRKMKSVPVENIGNFSLSIRSALAKNYNFRLEEA